MIKSFKHRGLKRFFERDDKSKVRADMAGKVGRILHKLDLSKTLDELDAPGFGLHPLRGDYKEFWSIWVSRNYRVIFRFENGNAYDVDLIDYH